PLSAVSGQKGRLRFGGRLRQKTKLRDNIFYEYTPMNADNFANLAVVSSVNYTEPLTVGRSFVPGKFMDPKLLGGLPLSDASVFEQDVVADEFLTLNYDASESIYSGYVRWDQDLSRNFSVIIGARLEHTGLTYTGNLIEDDED